MTTKTKKALNITVNVIVCIIVLFVLILTINIIASSGKGYTNLFGNAYVSVQTDSMDGDKPDSFKPGDLLKVKILSEKQKNELKEGDIITFYDYRAIDGNNVRYLNSHRIVEIDERENGRVYRTRGDNEEKADSMLRKNEDIIGVVVSHTAGLGRVTDWFHSSTGFFVCVVLPSLLVVVYCIYNLVKVILERNKETEADKEARLKEQLLQQLRAEGKLAEEAEVPAEKTEKENENLNDAK